MSALSEHPSTPVQSAEAAVPRRAAHGDLLRSWDRLVERWARDLGAGAEDFSLSGGPSRSARRRRILRGRIEVTEHRVRLQGLPAGFEGFRIVQVSDIHHGLFLPFYAVLEAVEMVNALAPDVIALTGDFVTYSRAYVEPVAAILGLLRAKHGVFAVLGNHDFRVDADQVARALRREGIEVLRNRHTFLRHRGEALPIAGIDDLRYGADLTRALRGIRAGSPTVLLSHNPKVIRRAALHGVSLVLSGHTHGGQVKLPMVGSILGRSPERMRYKAGWDALGSTQIYVSRGIGTVVLPLRVRCPAEIPHFHLHSSVHAPGHPHRLGADG